MIKTGKYTPASSNHSNIDSLTVSEAQYAIIGDRFILSGNITLDPTAASDVQFELDLPPDVTLVHDTGNETSGTCTPSGVAGNGRVAAHAVNGTLFFVLFPTSANQFTWGYILMGQIA